MSHPKNFPFDKEALTLGLRNLVSDLKVLVDSRIETVATYDSQIDELNSQYIDINNRATDIINFFMDDAHRETFIQFQQGVNSVTTQVAQLLDVVNTTANDTTWTDINNPSSENSITAALTLLANGISQFNNAHSTQLTEYAGYVEQVADLSGEYDNLQSLGDSVNTLFAEAVGYASLYDNQAGEGKRMGLSAAINQLTGQLDWLSTTLYSIDTTEFPQMQQLISEYSGLLGILTDLSDTTLDEVAASNVAPVTVYSEMVIFGDEFVDATRTYEASLGYMPNESMGYYNGRWSNGAIWTDYLAKRLRVTGGQDSEGTLNFAFGGATTGAETIMNNVYGVSGESVGLLSQVDQYINSEDYGVKQSPRVLHVVSAGTNDLYEVAYNFAKGFEGGIIPTSIDVEGQTMPPSTLDVSGFDPSVLMDLLEAAIGGVGVGLDTNPVPEDASGTIVSNIYNSVMKLVHNGVKNIVVSDVHLFEYENNTTAGNGWKAPMYSIGLPVKEGLIHPLFLEVVYDVYHTVTTRVKKVVETIKKVSASNVLYLNPTGEDIAKYMEHSGIKETQSALRPLITEQGYEDTTIGYTINGEKYRPTEFAWFDESHLTTFAHNALSQYYFKEVALGYTDDLPSYTEYPFYIDGYGPLYYRESIPLFFGKILVNLITKSYGPAQGSAALGFEQPDTEKRWLNNDKFIYYMPDNQYGLVTPELFNAIVPNRYLGTYTNAMAGLTGEGVDPNAPYTTPRTVVERNEALFGDWPVVGRTTNVWSHLSYVLKDASDASDSFDAFIDPENVDGLQLREAFKSLVFQQFNAAIVNIVSGTSGETVDASDFSEIYKTFYIRHNAGWEYDDPDEYFHAVGIGLNSTWGQRISAQMALKQIFTVGVDGIHPVLTPLTTLFPNQPFASIGGVVDFYYGASQPLLEEPVVQTPVLGGGGGPVELPEYQFSDQGLTLTWTFNPASSLATFKADVPSTISSMFWKWGSGYVGPTDFLVEGLDNLDPSSGWTLTSATATGMALVNISGFSGTISWTVSMQDSVNFGAVGSLVNDLEIVA